jgi:hypothetical protein
LEGERRPGGAQTKDEVGREPTDEGGRAHWVRQAVAGRADAQIDALHGPKVPLDVGERLVGLDRRARRQRIIRLGGADHEDVVEPRLLRDRVLRSRKGEVTVRDLDVEVLSHLVAVEHPPGAPPDLSGIAEPSGGDGDDDLCEVGRDRPEQRLALSGPSGGEEGVLAGHEALAFVVGVCDLAEVLLVEQRGRDRTVSQERVDLRSPQRRHPSEAAGFFECRDTRRGDHAPVADEDDPAEPEARLGRLDDLDEALWGLYATNRGERARIVVEG